MRHPISNRAASVAEIEVIVADVSSRVGEAGGMHRSHDVAYWIETTTKRGPRIRSVALARLGELGILESASEGAVRLTARVSRSRCYTGPDGQSVEDVRLRIISQLFSDDIPNPRDAVIIALAEAAGAFDGILSESERSQAQERIDRFRQLDLIGRSVTAALSDAAEQDVPVTARAKTIPKAPGLPLIGNALAMSRDLHGFLVEQYRNLGPISRVRAPGRNLVVPAGPEANLFMKKADPFLRTQKSWIGFSREVGAGRFVPSMMVPSI